MASSPRHAGVLQRVGFQCRHCTPRIARRRSVAECRELKAKLGARLDYLAARAALMTERIPKTIPGASPQVVETAGAPIAS